MTDLYGRFRLEVAGHLEALSRFRIGSGDQLSLRTDMPVLRWSETPDELPYIPGSSLRGVLRAHLEREHSLLGCPEEVLTSLFGDSGQPREDDPITCRGRLRIFDVVPKKHGTGGANPTSLVFEIRDHVRIDLASGAAASTAKFDCESVRAHPQWLLPFRLIYEGENNPESDQNDELALLHEGLRALESQELVIGGRSSIGFGRFKLVVTEYRGFDRSTPDGLLSFLRYRLGLSDGSPSPTFAFPTAIKEAIPPRPQLGPLHFLSLQFGVYCNGPLLIKAAPPPEKNDDRPDSVCVITTEVHTDGSKHEGPYIPGSSIRGVLRHRAACICASQSIGQDLVGRLFGAEKGSGQERRGLALVDDSPIISVETVDSDHVAVDRITHAAATTKKFDTRALDSPSFALAIHAAFSDDPEDLAAIALLLALTQDLLSSPDIPAFGSITSRGYGSLDRVWLRQASGSFHGALGKVIEGLASPAQGSSRPGRVGFEVKDNQTKSVIERLCDEFDKHWQNVRHREVPA